MNNTKRGPPKHQNRYAWKPNAGQKKNETEVGGKLKPYSEITGVCPRCRDQIQWKRAYGKYKPLVEPAKCHKCSKRNVRQAYHNLCSGCAKEFNVCAKCSCHVERTVGRDAAEVEAEQEKLREAIMSARERERRTLLRTMDKGKTRNASNPLGNEKKKVADLFPDASLDEYAELNRDSESDEEDEEDTVICN
ncbi:hypothetical protein Syun_021248 [Stephania yunnanensis]|uniref:Uncharacterized protein n=1 Tax=Stephania yunnanensis TaxID=152371 RepID=A0AAP0IGQ6_9MAGN